MFFDKIPQLRALVDACRDYMLYYNNILRLVVLGILPFVMLVFFNTKIYSDVKVRGYYIKTMFSLHNE